MGSRESHAYPALLSATASILFACADHEVSDKTLTAGPGAYTFSETATSSGSQKPSGQPIFVSPDLKQVIYYSPGDKDLSVRTYERAPGATALSLTSKHLYSTSYVIKKIVPSAQANMFLVNGRGRNGDDILERWHIQPAEGGFFASRFLATTGVGAAWSSLPLDVGIEGGQWVQPSGVPQVDRTEVFRGNLGDPLLGVAADPDGRYVVFNAGAVVYQLDILDANAAPNQILSSTEFPEIDKVRSIRIWEDNSGVRVVILDARARGNSIGALPDLDNDGLFDPVLAYPASVWAQQGLDSTSAWASDFLYYF